MSRLGFADSASGSCPPEVFGIGILTGRPSLHAYA